MSVIQVLSIVVLLIAFPVAMWRGVNVGLVMLPLAYVMGLFGGLKVDEVTRLFPVSIALLIIGVMYLFVHARESGAIDLIVSWAVRLCGGRKWLMPWAMFALAGVISAIGTLPGATVAIVLPIAMKLAHANRISNPLMAILTMSGAVAFGFSPVGPWTGVVTTAARTAGVAYPQVETLVMIVVLVAVVCVVAYLVYGLRATVADASGSGYEQEAVGVAATTAYVEAHRVHGGVDLAEPAAAAAGGRKDAPLSGWQRAYRVTSLLSFVAFLVATFGFDFDPAAAGFILAAVMHLVFRPDSRVVIASLPWTVILLSTGVLVYVGVLERLGTLDAIKSGFQGFTSAAVAVIAVLYLTAIFATFESSTIAVLGIIVPIATVALGGDPGPWQAAAIFAAMAVVAGAVAVSPFHLGGALAVSSVETTQQPVLFRTLLVWSLAAAAVVPIVGFLLPLAVGL